MYVICRIFIISSSFRGIRCLRVLLFGILPGNPSTMLVRVNNKALHLCKIGVTVTRDGTEYSYLLHSMKDESGLREIRAFLGGRGDYEI
jgi:hypothetical protein